MEEVSVVIVGAGPAGLAISACLNRASISNIVLEREDCYASLWKKRAYDRLKLHIAKKFCELPYMPYPKDAPTFVPKSGFVSYLDEYVSKFNIHPLYHRTVEDASYDKSEGKWHVEAMNSTSNLKESYVARFLVIATGINSEGIIPNVPGLENFQGEVLHSSMYQNGQKYEGERVLVVGSGNSGMEISFDLSNWGAKTSVVVRSPVHIVTKRMVHLGMVLLKYLPYKIVDTIIVHLSKFRYGDISKFGIQRPHLGPFTFKRVNGRTPTIDVGALDRIKAGEIKVLPEIKKIFNEKVMFVNDKIRYFDAIIFATGYRSTVRKWLKDGAEFFDESGVPESSFPNNWKLGQNGLYCAGFSNMGLCGISNDAKDIANDIQLKAIFIIHSHTLTELDTVSDPHLVIYASASHAEVPPSSPPQSLPPPPLTTSLTTSSQPDICMMSARDPDALFSGGGISFLTGSRKEKYSYGYSTFKGKRPSMEDYYETSVSEVDGQMVAFFGVFDGHGGYQTAEYLKNNLFKNLTSHPEFITDTKKAIVEVFKQTDVDYLNEETGQQKDAGSTATTAVLVGDRLIVANVGDSRVVASRAGSAIPLSIDHKPDRSDERQRIEEAGGFILWLGTWRVGGILAVSRAFGDKLLKPYVVADPEIQEEKIDSVDFIIVASDGLWNVLSNKEAVDLVQEETDAEAASRKLTNEAYARGSCDNITCIVVRFNKA
ncbi:hypothetical protein ACFE04_025935 [Oxalis oulophora]